MNSLAVVFLIGRALDYAMKSDRNIKNAKRKTPINLIQTAKIETEPTVFRPFHSFQSRLLWMAFPSKQFCILSHFICTCRLLTQ